MAIIPKSFFSQASARDAVYASGARELLEDGLPQQAVHVLLKQGLDVQQIQDMFIRLGYPGGKPPPKPPPFDPNTVPALTAKLSAIVSAWELKFGDTWVAMSALQGDEFWGPATARLDLNGLLENLDKGGKWFRLKESVGNANR